MVVVVKWKAVEAALGLRVALPSALCHCGDVLSKSWVCARYQRISASAAAGHVICLHTWVRVLGNQTSKLHFAPRFLSGGEAHDHLRLGGARINEQVALREAGSELQARAEAKVLQAVQLGRFDRSGRLRA
jgi:hypothetical protein